MKKKRIGGFVAVLLIGLCAAWVSREAAAQHDQDDEAEVRLQAAMHTELVEGDLDKAIQLYQGILANHRSNREVAARALLQMAQSYEKLGRPEATETYQRVLHEYADQAASVTAARIRLEVLSQAAGAGGLPGLVARLIAAGGEEVDFSATPSADGRYLFRSDLSEQGAGDLAMQEIATGETRRLTDERPLMTYGGFSLYPVPSPDGKAVVASWLNEEYNWELRLVGLDGGPGRTLYRNEELSYVTAFGWTPDAEQILTLFERRDRTNQIVLVSVADGSTRTVKSFDWRAPTPSLSPDGRYVAYDFPPQEDSLQRDIYLLAADGSREVPLVEHPAHDFNPIWAPDGSGILFVSDRTGTMDAWFLDVEDGRPTGSPRMVKRNLGDVLPRGFTRDGSLFYSVNPANTDIYTLTIDPDQSKIVEPPKTLSYKYEGANSRPDWSPDGKYLAYRSARGSIANRGSRTPVLVVHSLETGQEQEFIFRELGYEFWPQWSPDGKSILIQGSNRQGRRSFYRFDPQTGDLDLVAPFSSGQRAVWGPEGRTIFYGRVRLVVRDLDTGEDRILYPSRTGQVRELAISPDGQRLAFKGREWIRDREEGLTFILVVPATGGEPRKLRVATPYRAGLAWMKNGKDILFGKEEEPSSPEGSRSWGLWRISAEGGEPQRLGLIAQEGADVAAGNALVKDLSVHPDGRRVAFTLDRGYVNELWVLENLLTHIKGIQ